MPQSAAVSNTATVALKLPTLKLAMKVKHLEPKWGKDRKIHSFCPYNADVQHSPGDPETKLKTWLQDGQIVAQCDDCGIIPNFAELIGLKPTQPEPELICLQDIPTVEPEPELICLQDIPSFEIEPEQVEPVEPEPVKPEPVKPVTTTKRTFTPLRELAKKHPGSKPMMIRDYFPSSSIFTVFGEPGSGKTTVVIDAICCIDTGKEWRGKKVSKGIVWYIAAEDPYGVRLRIESWYDANGFIFERDTNMEIREEPICFAEPDEVSALIEEVNSIPKEEKPTSIVLDTLADTAGKYDFNNNMGLFCRGFERFRNETGVSLIIIHHCGHAAKDRPRNGSELGGKSDVIMPVKCKDGITTLSVSKLKNGSKDKTPPLSWKMNGVATKWLDADGEIITSVIIEPTGDQPKPKGEFITKSEMITLDALREALRKYGIEDRGIVSVSEDDWRKEAIGRGVSDAGTEDGKRRAFSRAKSSLIQRDNVTHHEGRYWIPLARHNKTDKT